MSSEIFLEESVRIQSSEPIGLHTSRKSKAAGKAISRAVAAVIEPLEARTLLTTVVPAIADTFVRNNDYALTNFGASPLLFVKNAASGDTRVAYLKFDLTGVTTINSAVLQLSGSLENNLGTAVATGVYGVADSSWIQGNGTIADSIGDGFDTSNNPPGEMTFNNAPVIGIHRDRQHYRDPRYIPDL